MNKNRNKQQNDQGQNKTCGSMHAILRTARGSCIDKSQNHAEEDVDFSSWWCCMGICWIISQQKMKAINSHLEDGGCRGFTPTIK